MSNLIKSLNYLMKASSAISLIAFLLISTNGFAQDITGKWESLAYNEVVHFHEEGILRMVGDSGEGYGMYAVEEDYLAIAFFNEEETKMNYTISFNEDGTLNLQESETGEVYPFVYTGTAEIPAEILEQIRLALNSPDTAEEAIEAPAEAPFAEAMAEKPVKSVQVVNPNSGNTHNALPGTLPSPGTRGVTGIEGTWEQESSAIGKETLVLTADGFFMMTAEAQFPDLYPQTYGYGRYHYENGQLKLSFFNYFQTYDKETVLQIHDLNTRSFNVPYNFYGDVQDNRYLYKGAPELHESHRKILLAWVNFHRLQGQWKSKSSVLKFMGNGEVFVENATGKYTFSQFDISSDGVTVNFEPLDGETNNYYYSGRILELTPEKLILQDVKGGDPEVFTFQGKTMLNPEQIQLYTAYMQGQHRINMGIIDMMDGRQDWIWVEEKNY